MDGLCLSIEEGECFGLLGPNGAGKTTTIQMITKNISNTSGEFILGNKQPNDVMIGLCGQEDIVYDQLTIKQHLQLIAMIKV